MKTCTKCGEEKPLVAFHPSPWKDGRRPDCKDCRSEQEKARRRRLGTTEMTVRKYGLNEDIYNEVLQIQRGGCALCGARPGARGLPVDHDHATGDNRGILCATCNGGLGMFKDSPELLRRAADYLEFWQTGWKAALAWQEQNPVPEESYTEYEAIK